MFPVGQEPRAKRKRNTGPSAAGPGPGKTLVKSQGLSSEDPGSSEQEDSELERNFALLSKKGEREQSGGKGEEEEEEESGSEEEEEEEEEEEGESDGEEEGGSVSDGEEEALGGSEEDDDDDEEQGSDGDSGDSDDDDGQPDRGGEIQTEDDIKKELSTMSFEEVLKLRSQVGTKVYDQAAYGSTQAPPRPATKKRLNKNRPMEMSSKRHAPFLRQVVPVKKAVLRDPRFDDLSGDYKPEIFEKTYRFVNDIKQREREVVQKKLTKATRVNQKEKLQFLLKRMENQERARKSREQQREKEVEWKRKQREMAGEGLTPFFLKKSDKKKMELAEKYQDLKKSGKLDNFLSKKRKRNAGKDRRKLPFQHKGQ